MRAMETRRSTFRWHEFIVAFLIRTIGTWAEKKGGLVVLGSGYRLRVSDRRGAMPDVQVLTEEGYDAAGANGLEHGRPELVIEVLSPSSRAHDGLRKLDWYASLGVPEFWLVDAETRIGGVSPIGRGDLRDRRARAGRRGVQAEVDARTEAPAREGMGESPEGVSSRRGREAGLDGPGEPRRDLGRMEHLPQGDPAAWTW